MSSLSCSKAGLAPTTPLSLCHARKPGGEHGGYGGEPGEQGGEPGKQGGEPGKQGVEPGGQGGGQGVEPGGQAVDDRYVREEYGQGSKTTNKNKTRIGN